MQLLLGEPGRPVDGDLGGGYGLEPLDGPVIAILPDLADLVRVVLAEDVIHGDVDGHHQDERVPVGSGRGEDGVAVVVFAQVAAHLLDGPVLADLDDGGVGDVAVMPEQRVQDLPVDGGVVVLQCDELAHI